MLPMPRPVSRTRANMRELLSGGARQQHPPQRRQATTAADLEIGEAEIRQQPAQRPSRVEMKMIAERLGVTLDAAQRDRSASVRGRRQQEATARDEYPPHLGQPAVSATCSITSLAHTSANVQSSNGSGASSGTSSNGSSGCLARARASADSATSAPITSAPADASSSVKSPAPQPRSSTRSPGVIPERSRKSRRRTSSGGARSSGSCSQRSSKKFLKVTGI